ncbi:hypothetical protein AB0I53_07695 [Saccharopolyspora sp. NPDC050389]|uniref:hypothetical protein n=1 Tax=Saccharopolyspora sp. NPDC050389 TaxID=3155516 RepID=UPI0033D754C5
MVRTIPDNAHARRCGQAFRITWNPVPTAFGAARSSPTTRPPARTAKINADDPVGGSGLASLEERDSSGVQVWAWAAIATVVVLGGGGATLILLRRKRKPTPQQWR